MLRLEVGLYQMGVRRYQDLKKPKFFSSPTVGGLVLGTSYGNDGRFLNQMAKRAAYDAKGTTLYITSTNKLFSPFISGVGRGAHGMQDKSNDGTAVRATIPDRDRANRRDARWGSW